MAFKCMVHFIILVSNTGAIKREKIRNNNYFIEKKKFSKIKFFHRFHFFLFFHVLSLFYMKRFDFNLFPFLRQYQKYVSSSIIILQFNKSFYCLSLLVPKWLSNVRNFNVFFLLFGLFFLHSMDGALRLEATLILTAQITFQGLKQPLTKSKIKGKIITSKNK